MNWTSYLDGFATLFEQGGMVLRAIVFVSVCLWFLLLERYWFHRVDMPNIRQRLRRDWQRDPAGKLTPRRVRRIKALVGELRAQARRNLRALSALVAVLPLLGLLGTVSGMIKVFEVITIFGTGNTRGMASGISEALVTTMAGLFTALSGLYFVADLEGRAEDIARNFEAELAEDA